MFTEQVYSVTQLTQAIKDLLEESFASLWVEGEVSNFRAPSSGHFYFTLKDATTQIRAVMFRSRNAVLPFIPEDGLQVICRANLSVYPPRGDYQLIVQSMEAAGDGVLLDSGALDALRALQREGSPDFLLKMVALYLKSAPDLIHRMEEAVSDGDAEEAHLAAHSLKSSSALLGAHHLSTLCREVENTWRARDLNGAEQQVARIQAAFAGVERALAALLGGSRS